MARRAPCTGKDAQLRVTGTAIEHPAHLLLDVDRAERRCLAITNRLQAVTSRLCVDASLRRKRSVF
jgi:hypothetical protein